MIQVERLERLLNNAIHSLQFVTSNDDDCFVSATLLDQEYLDVDLDFSKEQDFICSMILDVARNFEISYEETFGEITIDCFKLFMRFIKSEKDFLLETLSRKFLESQN